MMKHEIIDNFLPEEIANKIEISINNDTSENQESLRKRASLFSWEKAAEQYLEIYNTILS